MLQCVAVCCRLLKCVAVRCSVSLYDLIHNYIMVLDGEVIEKSIAVYRSALQCAAVCCSVLQCVAVCCSVLQCAAM